MCPPDDTHNGDARSKQEDPDQEVFKLLHRQLPEEFTWTPPTQRLSLTDIWQTAHTHIHTYIYTLIYIDLLSVNPHIVNYTH